MNVYKIHVQHFSQKDSHSSIEAFLLADSDEAVYQWVDKKQYGMYTDRNNEDGLIDIYDSEYNVIGQETFKDKMIRIKGEYFDENYEPQDCYYGVTIYGWEKLDSKILDTEIEALKNLGVLKEV